MKSIVENNKIIAEFMGYKLSLGTTDEYDTPYRVGEMLFNSDWNWIMSVVEKIQKTNLADIIIHAKNMVEISYNGQTKTYFSGSLIENCFNACVEFINQLKTKRDEK